jgi:predicted MPP superfamily phosphohydrolase
MLNGHTHGGQVPFFGLYTPFKVSKYGEKYRTGLIKKDSLSILVTNGIGTYMYPVRFSTRPQINIIYLKSKNK